jgi:two-component system, sensor histidine kinase and response regulator
MKLLVHELSLLNERKHRYNHKHMTSKDPLATSGLPTLDKNVSSPDGQTVEPKFLILVVDDSADNVAVISLDLQQQGYRVVTASDGEDAVAIATQMLPNLILMDINLPTLDGLGATRRIRETDELRDVPIVAITAFGTEGFQRAAYDAGISGYLTKPLDFDRMHLLIARLLSPSASGSLTSQS